MTVSKTVLSTVLAVAIGGTASIASANTTMTEVVNGVSVRDLAMQAPANTNVTNMHARTILDGSTTATFFYKKGVRQFDAGDLEKAEAAFKATLRANGLDRQALHYLVVINDLQGDRGDAQNYAERYAQLDAK